MKKYPSLHDRITLLQEYAQIRASGTKYEISGKVKVLCQRYDVTPTTLRRWSKDFADDMRLYDDRASRNAAEMDSMREELRRLQRDYATLAHRKSVNEPAHNYWHRQAIFYKNQVSEVREELVFKTKRINHLIKRLKSTQCAQRRWQQRAEDLGRGDMRYGIRGNRRDVSDEAHSSLSPVQSDT